MAQETAIDVSRWQSTIDWSKVTAPIAIIKMTGGDDGLYTDSQANRNYYQAKANGKAVGMYHFAGGTNPEAEADYFVEACSPLEQDDVLILDWELNGHADPVEWCRRFNARVIEKAGVIPMFYTNASRLVADRDQNGNTRYLNWMPVVQQNAGLWVAHYGIDPQGNVPIKWFPTYVMHQYTSTGRMPGIDGDVDINVFYGSVVQFKRYGYNVAAPAPTPTPAPVHNPVPEHQPAPLPPESPVDVPQPTPIPPTPEAPQPTVPENPPTPVPVADPVPTPSPEPDDVSGEPAVVVDKDTEQPVPPVKPGYKTTEFYVVVALLVTLLNKYLGLDINEADIEVAITAIMTIAGAAFVAYEYIRSRRDVKKAAIREQNKLIK